MGNIHKCDKCKIEKPDTSECAGLRYCRRCVISLANRRQLAFLIDCVVIIAALWVTLPLVYLVFGISGVSAELNSNTGLKKNILSFCAMAMSGVYFLFKDRMFPGRSFGKKLLKILVIDIESGKPCAVQGSILRNLPFSVQALILIIPVYIIENLMITYAFGRRIGDRLAGTAVIFEKNLVSLDTPQEPVWACSKCNSENHYNLRCWNCKSEKP